MMWTKYIDDDEERTAWDYSLLQTSGLLDLKHMEPFIRVPYHYVPPPHECLLSRFRKIAKNSTVIVKTTCRGTSTYEDVVGYFDWILIKLLKCEAPNNSIIRRVE